MQKCTQCEKEAVAEDCPLCEECLYSVVKENQANFGNVTILEVED